MKRYGIAPLLLILMACGGTTNRVPQLNNPTRLLPASVDITIQGAVRRIAYVANNSSGTVSTIDLRRRVVVDTNTFDNDETSLTIGGEPVDLFEWQPADLAAGSAYRLGVIDQSNARLFMFEVAADTARGSEVEAHQFIDLGGPTVAFASRPIFRDQGRLSNPTLLSVAVDSAIVQTESWVLASRGNGIWDVEGSISGRQRERAVAGTSYSTADGAITFTIVERDLVSTDNDRFYFGTVKANPLPLSGRPVAARLVDDTLFIVDQENSEIDVLDLTTLTFGASVSIDDGSGFQVVPSSVQLRNNDLIISNSAAGNSLIRFDTTMLSTTIVALGLPTAGGFFRNDDTYMAVPLETNELHYFDLGSNTLDPPAIAFPQLPQIGAMLNGDEGVDGDALLATSGNALDLLDLSTRERVDTRESGSIESFASRVVFFDELPDSNPQIIEVVTQDGQTQSESWTLNFEGIIVNTPSTNGTTSAANLNDSGADFLSGFVQVGDLVVLYPNNSSLRETFSVDAIVDGQNLTLDATPVAQTGSIPYEIRAPQAYTVTGSISGFQSNRLVEGGNIESDGGEIIVTLNTPSNPSTRGDTFTFDTNDGITPITLSGNLPRDIAIFESRAYILNKGSNNVSVISVPALRLDTIIN